MSDASREKEDLRLWGETGYVRLLPVEKFHFTFLSLTQNALKQLKDKRVAYTIRSMQDHSELPALVVRASGC